MSPAFVIGTLLLITAPIETSNFDNWPVQTNSIHLPVQLPPRAYQHPSTFIVSTVPSNLITLTCDRLGATHADAACERDGAVYLPNPCDFPRDDYARLMCHEMGHINGWSANHSDAQ